MSSYHATVIWQRHDQVFTDNKYSRAHEWLFQGQDKKYSTQVAASSSHHVVPLPYSVEENVDPEEAFVASLSSCHMLFFLSLAAKERWLIDHYEDQAVGILGKNAQGKMAMTEVTLMPKVTFAGTQPTRDSQEELHHQAHELCFIANSVLTNISVTIR